MRRNDIIILTLATTFILIITIFSVQVFLNAEYFNHAQLIKSDKFGDFGSFYGGVLGTLVAIIALIILFKTFFYQRIQSELFIINKLYDDIINDINDLEYKTFKGIKALINFDSEHDDPKIPENRNSVMNHLSLILTNFINLINITKKSRYISKYVKEINLDRIYLMYNAKITWPVFEKIYDKMYDDYKNGKGQEKKGLKHHTDASIIFPRYEKLVGETYHFLEPRGHINFPKMNKKMMNIINKHYAQHRI